MRSLPADDPSPACAPSRPRPGARSSRPAQGLLLAAALLCVGLSGPVRAEKADREKPINVEADRMQYDDLKQINVFTGNVVMTKGTIIIRADRVVVRQDPEGYQYGTAQGTASKLASFRQRRDDGPDLYVEGYAIDLEYDGRRETVTLDQKASLRKLDRGRVTDEAQGNRIVYQSLSEFYTVESGGAASSSSNPGGRVRVTLQPKTEPPPPTPGRPAGGAPVELRPDPGLGPSTGGAAGESRR